MLWEVSSYTKPRCSIATDLTNLPPPPDASPGGCVRAGLQGPGQVHEGPVEVLPASDRRTAGGHRLHPLAGQPPALLPSTGGLVMLKMGKKILSELPPRQDLLNSDAPPAGFLRS